MSSDIDEIRLEIEHLKRRIDELEIRLETRIAAAELKQDLEIKALDAKWTNLTIALEANTRMVSNLSSQQTASHYALVHLLAVTARQVRVPDSDLSEALRIAKEAMEMPK